VIWTLAVLLTGLHLLLLSTTLCTCGFERQIKRRAKTKRESSLLSDRKVEVCRHGRRIHPVRCFALLGVGTRTQLRPCDYSSQRASNVPTNTLLALLHRGFTYPQYLRFHRFNSICGWGDQTFERGKAFAPHGHASRLVTS